MCCHDRPSLICAADRQRGMDRNNSAAENGSDKLGKAVIHIAGEHLDGGMMAWIENTNGFLEQTLTYASPRPEP